MEAGVETITYKTKCMVYLVNNMQVDMEFETVTKFNHLGKSVSFQNGIHEEIKNRMDSRKVSTILSRIFCLPIGYLTISRLKVEKYNFAGCFMWLSHFVSHAGGRIFIESVQ
jgi:hypothetical protein